MEMLSIYGGRSNRFLVDGNGTREPSLCSEHTNDADEKSSEFSGIVAGCSNTAWCSSVVVWGGKLRGVRGIIYGATAFITIYRKAFLIGVESNAARQDCQ